ncbi:MAG: bifunctional non-ous end joining protein LigD [Chloroflexota bacterium]|jgi:bifunctional non-homologous end joining protein LigD|nr:bifunctional non-ous end joining protein LigD [Chloroflexota bacterium]
MSLDTYKKKRDFRKTPEPAGEVGAPPRGSRRYVVQRHRATRLHYDFRLEIDGVLVSWAVPRGPSLNPAERRMAVHVEDHPLDYFDFEGVIPKGEYGGGDVIVWDWGTFEPEETDDPGKAVAQGELKFRLDGEKLHGRFTIVRTRGYNAGQDDWLLIHKKDEFADTAWDVDALPRSVKTGRTNDEVKAGRDAVWDSSAPAAEAAIDLSGARTAKLPNFIDPMAATLAGGPFDDPDWIFELKLDGYRIEAVVDKGKVKLWTRNQQDAARYFPDLAAAKPTWIKADQAIVDGEVVALDREGKPTFSLLQDRAGMGRFGPRPVPPAKSSRGGKSAAAKEPDDGFVAPVVYYVFDILYHDGRLLTDVPLEARKRLLRSLLRDHESVRYAAHFDEGKQFYEVVRQQGLEGLIAKLRTSRYEVGKRSKAWLKIKIRREQEVVVIGYELGKGARADLGSLILAVRDGNEWSYVGEVGSGLGNKTIRQLKKELDDHAVDAPVAPNAPRIRGARWSEPRLVVRVEFSEWTDDGLLRQSAYKGLEIGKDPKSVRREVGIATGPAVKAAESEVKQKARAGGKATKSSASKGRLAPSKSDPPRAEEQKPQGATKSEMAALEAMRKDGNWEVGGESVNLTNLDKVLFPEPGFTKRDLIRYYVEVAPVLLPHLAGRALNLSRWPDGVNGHTFWQKQIPDWAPDWIARWDYPEAGSSESHTYLVADQVATMAWLANHATIDLHPWTSRTESYRNPTFALIDIDPGEETTFADILTLARLYRAALDHLGVIGLPKTTGKRGIQIWVPVRPGYTYRETSDWVEALSRAVGAAAPQLISWEWAKRSRRGLARLDFTQNAVNKTLVAPYAVRPVANAAVSTPLSWDELDDPSLRPDKWDIRTVLPRIKKRGDLFAPALTLEQELPDLA